MKTRGSNGFGYPPIDGHHEIFLRPRQRKPATSPEETSPPILRTRRPHQTSYHSSHRTFNFRLRKQAIHKSSSSDDTSTTDSDEELQRYDKRKSKNIAKARERLLRKFKERDFLRSKGPLRDRQKIGLSLADVDPMSIDKTILFNSIGGLDEHVQSLKEMILFPLMYPEVFEKFKISPPRGVLFHGPPGTGKTLVARALANECSLGDRKVTFFMRKGADCLSKWVGESERQLRLLFDQAYMMQPSIIFFDEIDGIAPVRSTRQDQIHSSIVSTLLALMDGLDSRGEVVVIGATNRIDAIDPALRRPGRFDREFFFPSPSFEARKRILDINTSIWKPPLEANILHQLATLSVGYCGADLKALCAEAALVALKRCYPQIYLSNRRLLLNMDEISVQLPDFLTAMQKIVPSSQRSIASPARPLNVFIKPLLDFKLKHAIEMVTSIFPLGKFTANSSSFSHLDNSKINSPDLISNTTNEVDNDQSEKIQVYKQFNCDRIGIYRPRFLLHGEKEHGQSTHLGPALLHHFENVAHIKLDLPVLYNVSSKTPEEALANVFAEAEKRLPVIIYMPHVNLLWPNLSDALKATFLTILDDLEPSKPLLLLATSDLNFALLPNDLQEIFTGTGISCQLMEMKKPNDDERRSFFSQLFLEEIYLPPPELNQIRELEELPLAPTPEPKKLSEPELKKKRRKEEATLRELRLFLRDILNKLIRDRRFQIFAKPVDVTEVPDYPEVVQNPMDLETMMSKIDLHQYECAKHFLDDIELIRHNALEYNPARDSDDKLIRHRACMLLDTALSLIENEMDSDFEDICREINKERVNRGESPTKNAPSNYRAIPNQITATSINEDVKDQNSNQTIHLNADEDTEIESLKSYENNNSSIKLDEEDTEIESESYRKLGSKKPNNYYDNSMTECDEPDILQNNVRKKVRRKRSSCWSSRKKAKKQCKRIPEKKAVNGKVVNMKVEVVVDNKENDPNTSSNSLLEAKLAVDNSADMITEDESETEKALSEEVLTITHDNQTTTQSTSSEPTELTEPTDELNANETVKNEIIIDKVKVNKLFDRAVDVTKNLSVEELEKLHSNILHLIMKRKSEWDRTGLIKEIGAELDNYELEELR